jgi:hypothetical protein
MKGNTSLGDPFVILDDKNDFRTHEWWTEIRSGVSWVDERWWKRIMKDWVVLFRTDLLMIIHRPDRGEGLLGVCVYIKDWTEIISKLEKCKVALPDLEPRQLFSTDLVTSSDHTPVIQLVCYLVPRFQLRSCYFNSATITVWLHLDHESSACLVPDFLQWTVLMSSNSTQHFWMWNLDSLFSHKFSVYSRDSLSFRM